MNLDTEQTLILNQLKDVIAYLYSIGARVEAKKIGEVETSLENYYKEVQRGEV